MRTKVEPHCPPDPKELWSRRPGAPTAGMNLSLVLVTGSQLPVRFWKPFFFFKGAGDPDLLRLSGGRFPLTTTPGKTHPVISLEPLPGLIGYRVCPCSTKKPFRARVIRYIRKGCRLLHTDRVMDQNSYVIESVEIPLPAALASKLRFQGEAPVECIITVDAPKG